MRVNFTWGPLHLERARTYTHFLHAYNNNSKKTAKIFTRKSRAKHQYRYTILCRSFLFLFFYCSIDNMPYIHKLNEGVFVVFIFFMHICVGICSYFFLWRSIKSEINDPLSFICVLHWYNGTMQSSISYITLFCKWSHCCVL